MRQKVEDAVCKSSNPPSMAHVAASEANLREAKAQLSGGGDSKYTEDSSQYDSAAIKNNLNISNHVFYLLAHSALPLGSFAYSSGLESFQEHHKHLQQHPAPVQDSTSTTKIATP